MTQPDLKTRAQQNRPAPSGNAAPNSSEPIVELQASEDPESIPTKVAWARVMRFCRGLPKGSTAIVRDKTGKEMYRYKYRGVDDVVSLAGAALREFGVTVMPIEIKPQHTVSGQATTCYVHVKYLITSLGEGEISGVSFGEGIDFGDKATVKALGQALRVFITTALMLPTYSVAWDSDASPVQRPMPPTPEELRDEMLNPKTSVQRMSTLYGQFRREPELGQAVVETSVGQETLLALNVRLGKERQAARQAATEPPDEVEL